MNALALILFCGGVGVLAYGVARVWLGRGSAIQEDAGSVGTLARLCQMTGGIIARLRIPGLDRQRPALERTAAYAGLDDFTWTAEALMGAYALAMLMGMAICGVLFKGWSPLLRALVGIGLGFWYARGKFKNLVAERQTALNKGFPYVLDLLHLSVHSGQGINTAIQQISGAVEPGPIREEFSRVIAQVQNGLGLSDAFRRMSARVVSPEVRAVLLALIQAMDRGAQVSDTLRTQAEQLRFSRLMAVEEEVEKLPTRMILPMTLFFMPCMFIMVLGPVIISTVLSLKGN